MTPLLTDKDNRVRFDHVRLVSVLLQTTNSHTAFRGVHLQEILATGRSTFGGTVVNHQPVVLRKFERSLGFFGLMASSRIAKGEFIFSVAGPIVTQRSQYSLQIDASRHVDSCGIRGLDDFINHACSPNAFVVFPELEIRALRDIEIGEEVLINYCATEEELFESFSCLCGSPHCYGQVRGFRFLSRFQQEALKNIVSPWLKDKYEL